MCDFVSFEANVKIYSKVLKSRNLFFVRKIRCIFAFENKDERVLVLLFVVYLTYQMVYLKQKQIYLNKKR